VQAAQQQQQIQKDYFDKHHGVRNIKEFHTDQQVWITNMKRGGKILGKADTPRSYWIETNLGSIRRNATHLRALPAKPDDILTDTASESGDSELEDTQSNTSSQEQQATTDDDMVPHEQPQPPGTPPPRQTRCGRTINTPGRYKL
jgi:hypothetical protein